MLDTSHFLVRALLAEGIVTEPEVQRAAEHAARNGKSSLDALVALGIVPSRKLAILRAKICECPFVDLSSFDIDIRNTRHIPRSVADRHGLFPLFMLDGVATVAMLDPLNLQAIDQARQLLKMDVDPVLCDPEQLEALIARAYSLARSYESADSVAGAAETDREDLTTGEEPIVAAVNQILAAAAEAGSTDIHINPDEHELHLRFRIDGVLHPQQGPAKAAHTGLVQRLKVLAHVDLTQTRKPQEGKFRFTHRGRPVDVRLSLVPTIHGENVVMRLLRPGGQIGGINELGMPKAVEEAYTEAVEHPHGMILVTGPTGSGKTTTLYTALAHINTPARNIITIEDPVEIRLPLIRQIQTNAEVGLTFASALRSILRQDPDVILVGEIRDQDTARIAVQSAMTGHLVFSTLHTNDAVGTIARLKDFGVPLFAINQAVLCIMAQRLIRRVCAACVEADTVTEQSCADMAITLAEAAALRRGKGCKACGHTGYKGRLGVYEMVRMTAGLRVAIERDAPASEILASARRDGMRSMWEDGLSKALTGLTTIEELKKLRAIIEEGDTAFVETSEAETADKPAKRKAA